MTDVWGWVVAELQVEIDWARADQQFDLRLTRAAWKIAARRKIDFGTTEYQDLLDRMRLECDILVDSGQLSRYDWMVRTSGNSEYWKDFYYLGIL